VEYSLAHESVLVKRLRRLGPLRWLPQTLTSGIIGCALITWLPLLIFTAYDGTAVGTKVKIPFLLDLVQYARFFVALPCAIALGEFVNPRLRNVLNSFARGGTVTSNDLPRLENATSRAGALTNSLIAEIVMLALVYLYVSLGLYREISRGMSSWNYPGNEALTYQAAHFWFRWVSMPLFLFSWFVWLWRLCVWAHLLYRISQLDLSVVATHPDRVGGLAFVHVGMRRFSVLVFGISSILSASIGEEILFNGAALRSYELELALFFIVCVVVILGPLIVFTPVLIRIKLEYWGKYGPLASAYVRSFDERWVAQKGYSRSEALLGTPDIQSLADLRHSYAGIAEMRTLLPNRTTVGIFAIAYVLPVLPLLASVISLRDILSEVYRLLLK